MKAKIAFTLLASTVASQALVTLGFSTGTNVADGWANSSGSKTATMVWGIIVDTGGDGFDGLAGVSTSVVDQGSLFSGVVSYESGFSLTSSVALPAGQLLNVGGSPSDDRLYISSNLMALVAGDVRITQLTNFAFDGATVGGADGDEYAIVWFDSTTLGSATNNATKWGAWTRGGSLPTASTTLPADPGSYTTAATGPAGMYGADGTAGTKVAGLTFVPEPSSMLLGLLGAVGLLRRRR